MSVVSVADGLAAEPPRAVHGDPILAAQHTFRVLLSAMATPGVIQQLERHPAVALAGSVGNPWLASALLALLDHEVSLAVVSMPAGEALADLLHRRTRTPLAPLEQADFVVAELTSLDPHSLERVKRGSLQYPDDGATLFLLVDSLAATSDPEAMLMVSGPGVDGIRAVFLPKMSDALLTARERANRHYPMGIDLILIDSAGQVIGLPRTSQLARQRGGV